jgi:hypothetical protein
MRLKIIWGIFVIAALGSFFVGRYLSGPPYVPLLITTASLSFFLALCVVVYSSRKIVAGVAVAITYLVCNIHFIEFAAAVSAWTWRGFAP